MPKLNVLISCMAVLVVLAGCTSNPQAATGHKNALQCSHADLSSKPDWVSKGYSYQRSGFLHGFGESIAKGQGFENQLAAAENAARADLIKGISVQVDSNISIETLENTNNSQINYTQNVRQLIQSSSNIKLPGLAIKDKWQDASSCTLYVLVEIPQATASLALNKTLAMSLYAQAQDESLSLGQRISAVNQAASLNQQYDFSRLNDGSNRAQLDNLFAPLAKQLQQAKNDYYHGIAVMGDDASNQAIAQQLLRRMQKSVSGSFINSDCQQLQACLASSRAQSAKLLSIISTTLTRSNQQGFHVGDLTLNWEVWDLTSNQRIAQISQLAGINTQVQLLARQLSGVNTLIAFNKWLYLNPKAIDLMSEKIPKKP